MPHFAQNWPLMPKPIKKKRNARKRLSAFGVHFFFGAILGSALGLFYWALRYGDGKTAETGLLCIGAGALAVGFVAGIARDEFWSGLRKKPEA